MFNGLCGETGGSGVDGNCPSGDCGGGGEGRGSSGGSAGGGHSGDGGAAGGKLHSKHARQPTKFSHFIFQLCVCDLHQSPHPDGGNAGNGGELGGEGEGDGEGGGQGGANSPKVLMLLMVATASDMRRAAGYHSLHPPSSHDMSMSDRPPHSEATRTIPFASASLVWPVIRCDIQL